MSDPIKPVNHYEIIILLILIYVVYIFIYFTSIISVNKVTKHYIIRLKKEKHSTRYLHRFEERKYQTCIRSKFKYSGLFTSFKVIRSLSKYLWFSPVQYRCQLKGNKYLMTNIIKNLSNNTNNLKSVLRL